MAVAARRAASRGAAPLDEEPPAGDRSMSVRRSPSMCRQRRYGGRLVAFAARWGRSGAVGHPPERIAHPWLRWLAGFADVRGRRLSVVRFCGGVRSCGSFGRGDLSIHRLVYSPTWRVRHVGEKPTQKPCGPRSLSPMRGCAVVFALESDSRSRPLYDYDRR